MPSLNTDREVQHTMRRRLPFVGRGALVAETIFLCCVFVVPLRTLRDLATTERMLASLDKHSDYSTMKLPPRPRLVDHEATNGTCTCVMCRKDADCGGLWRDEATRGNPHFFHTITLVVSHCLTPLGWLSEFTEGYKVHNVTILSKCGKAVDDAPSESTVVRLPNVGRCDHSYAHWISERVRHPKSPSDSREVVVFLKDDRSNESIHQRGRRWRSLSEMLRMASKKGFACGQQPVIDQGRTISAYHDTATLLGFEMEHYSSEKAAYDSLEDDMVPFHSNFSDMGHWAHAVGLEFPKELVNVCYAGTFAASVAHLRKQDASLWNTLERSLARGNNIEEGHFMERAWAGLLSEQLKRHQVEALLKRKAMILRFKHSIWGALSRRTSRQS